MSRHLLPLSPEQLTIKWLRVLDPAEMPHINHGVSHQFHRIVPTLDVLKPHQQPFEFILPRKRPFHAIS